MRLHNGQLPGTTAFQKTERERERDRENERREEKGKQSYSSAVLPWSKLADQGFLFSDQIIQIVKFMCV